MVHGHSVDEYLETIYFLAFSVGEYGPVVRDSPALAARVAEMLGVSAPSASEMLKRLEGEELIERGRRKEALLTPKGRAAAEHAVRRHRIIERLLTDFMGYTPYEAHEQADAMGDAMNDDMVDRISERLGHPDRCPHGWPVDPSFEQAENRELTSLAELEPSARATIVRLAEHDGALLRWFYDEGYVPGTEVQVRRVEHGADQLTVTVGGEDRAISDARPPACSSAPAETSVGGGPARGGTARPRRGSGGGTAWAPSAAKVAADPAVREHPPRRPPYAGTRGRVGTRPVVLGSPRPGPSPSRGRPGPGAGRRRR